MTIEAWIEYAAETIRRYKEGAISDRDTFDAIVNKFEEVEFEEKVEEVDPKTHMSRNDRLQAAADAGFDTWEDYRGEK